MNSFNRIPLVQQQKPQKVKEEKRKCKITKKRRRDGSIETSIEGCTPSEINALKEMGNFKEEEI